MSDITLLIFTLLNSSFFRSPKFQVESNATILATYCLRNENTLIIRIHEDETLRIMKCDAQYVGSNVQSPPKRSNNHSLRSITTFHVTHRKSSMAETRKRG